MPMATVTSKGQITIPVAVRNDLGLTAGDRIEFVRLDDGSYGMRPTSLPASSLKGFFGVWDGPAVSLDEMDAAVVAGSASS